MQFVIMLKMFLRNQVENYKDRLKQVNRTTNSNGLWLIISWYLGLVQRISKSKNQTFLS